MSQGGVLIGGEGPGKFGTLFHAQHASWPTIKPTRRGSAVELQLYSGGHIGSAKSIHGTNIIVATYGSFSSPYIEAGDILGFGETLYRIERKIDTNHLALLSLRGERLVFPSDAEAVYRHAYYYAEGKCDISGSHVRRISGDNFFYVAPFLGQGWIIINGERYRVEKLINTDELLIAGAATAVAGGNFMLKFLPASLQASMFTLQTLQGGAEENFSIWETIDGFVRMRANGHDGGTFRPIVIGTGPDNDFGYHHDHLVIGKNGQIGIGKNYASPSIGFPTSAKLHVWRDGLERNRPDGRHDVKLAVFETNHGGPGPRQVHIGSFNNFHAGYVQGYVDPAGRQPGPLTFNPLGGPVGINTGTQSAVTHALEVNGVVAPHTDAGSALGAPSHRWASLYAATGLIQTSDGTEKQDTSAIPDELLDAFQEVEPRIYRWRASVVEKGDTARHHLGYVAQEIAATLRAHGLDPARYGLWCSDELSAAETEDEAGTVVRPSGRMRQALRYDQLLALIDATNRRRYARLEARLDAIEARL